MTDHRQTAKWLLAGGSDAEPTMKAILSMEGERQKNRMQLRQTPTYLQANPRASGGGGTRSGGGKPTIAGVIAPILGKVANGQTLTAGEQDALNTYYRRTGGKKGATGQPATGQPTGSPTTTRAPKAGSKVYAALPKETLQDWLVEPSVWGTAGLYLGARRYQAKNIGGFVAVELTGLWISRSDLISQLGWQEVASAPASALATASPAKGAPPSDLWKNFAAALVSLQTQKPSFDVAGPRKTTHKQVEEYAALFGLEIPALNTVAASLDRLKAMMACEHDDDGKPIDPPDLSEKVS